MNKKELITLIAQDLDIEPSVAANYLNAVLESISKGLEQSGNISLLNFGRLFLVKQKARPVRNPSTGEPMMLKPSVIVKFRAGKKLKERVNKKNQM